jgi:hypothetical protein
MAYKIPAAGAVQTAASFNPTLLFGGANANQTGTYAGYYIKTGAQVDLQITITLTNKGTSTGNATIGNLPFSGSATTAQKWMPLFLQNCTATGATYTCFAAQAASGATTAAVFNFPQNAAIAIQYDHTNFSNTSILILTGTYWTDS